jgi:hypothetical protein
MEKSKRRSEVIVPWKVHEVEREEADLDGGISKVQGPRSKVQGQVR